MWFLWKLHRKRYTKEKTVRQSFKKQIVSAHWLENLDEDNHHFLNILFEETNLKT